MIDDPKFREDLFKSVCEMMDKQTDGMERSSLLWTSIGMKMLAEMVDERMLIQAGSAYWPLLVQKTGDDSTHVGYGWEFDSEDTMLCLQECVVPEMHVWFVLPDRGELVDFTTGRQDYWTDDMSDRVADLPPFFWGTEQEAKDLDFEYQPDELAIETAIMYLQHSPEPFAWKKDDPDPFVQNSIDAVDSD